MQGVALPKHRFANLTGLSVKRRLLLGTILKGFPAVSLLLLPCIRLWLAFAYVAPAFV
jgi:hypothetical protein